jgi:hypothetical protein
MPPTQIDFVYYLCYYNNMTALKTVHRSEKSELERLQLFYERIEDNRPHKKNRTKRS